MKLKTENIHEYRVKCNSIAQITLDDDFNVPDSKADIDTIVKEWGNVCINSVRVNVDKAQVDGELTFAVLYIGGKMSQNSHMPVKMDGKLPFLENVNLSCEAEGDYVTCHAQLEDLTIKAINSRKLSVKAIVTLTIVCESIEDIEISTDMEEDDDCNMQVLKDNLETIQLVVNQRDNFRIRENVSLPAGKPDIYEIVWDDVDVRKINTRITEEGLMLNGELNIFCMYLSIDEGQPVQWYETNVPFEGTLDVSGCNCDMIPYISFSVLGKSLEARQDIDGENRDISVELVLDMDVKAYEERKKEVIADMYSPVKEICTRTNKHNLKKLLIRNDSKCRVTGIIQTDPYINLLQICNCTATIQIDDYELRDKVIEVEGAICVNVIYISSDDNHPLGNVKSVIPFSNKIEVPNITAPCNANEIEYQLRPSIEQLSAMMNSNGNVEVKALISIDTICFRNICYEGIIDVEENENGCNYRKMPSMIGYISDGNKTLWDVAKKYHTTTESIKNSNANITEHMNEKSVIKRGEKLLLVKAGK